MKVLLLDGYPVGHPDKRVAVVAAETLVGTGHEVHHLCLDSEQFGRAMTAEERVAYHGPDPLVTGEARSAAEAVKTSEALLFCYPTTTFTLPAPLKGWLERVLVPGVSFVFDAKGRVRPGMTQIRRIGAITTTPHSRAATRRARDGGRRTILWTLRLSCHRLCRRTFVSLAAGATDLQPVKRALSRW